MARREREAPPNRRLVLFAHGSRDRRWLQTCERIARRVAESLGEESTALAYLQMAEPTLDRVAAAAAREGVARLVLLPLFFSAGGHVAHDVPDVVAAVRRRHPALEVEVLAPVGEDERFIELVVALSREGIGRG